MTPEAGSRIAWLHRYRYWHCTDIHCIVYYVALHCTVTNMLILHWYTLHRTLKCTLYCTLYYTVYYIALHRPKCVDTALIYTAYNYIMFTALYSLLHCIQYCTALHCTALSQMCWYYTWTMHSTVHFTQSTSLHCSLNTVGPTLYTKDITLHRTVSIWR